VILEDKLEKVDELMKDVIEEIKKQKVIASGIVTIERDLSNKVRLWDFYIIGEDRKPVSIYDLFAALERRKVKIILYE